MRLSIFAALLAVITVSFGQQNIQNYTPSILFDKGDWEFKTFQNFYTQKREFDGNGGTRSKGQTENFFTSINQFLYGVNDQINVGFDVWVKSSNNSSDLLDPTTGVSGFGPRIKIAPFKNLPRLSIQSTYLFNPLDDPEGAEGSRYFLEWDADLWLNQLFFDLPINDKSQLFFQQAFWHRIVNENSSRENNFLQTQTSVFYSYFPNSRWTLYGMTEYFPTHYNGNDQAGEAFFSYFVQSGAGLKYQLIPNVIELEALYTNFWMGSESEGAGETFNLGIRIINQ